MVAPTLHELAYRTRITAKLTALNIKAHKPQEKMPWPHRVAPTRGGRPSDSKGLYVKAGFSTGDMPVAAARAREAQWLVPNA